MTERGIRETVAYTIWKLIPLPSSFSLAIWFCRKRSQRQRSKETKKFSPKSRVSQILVFLSNKNPRCPSRATPLLFETGTSIVYFRMGPSVANVPVLPCKSWLISLYFHSYGFFSRWVLWRNIVSSIQILSHISTVKITKDNVPTSNSCALYVHFHSPSMVFVQSNSRRTDWQTPMSRFERIGHSIRTCCFFCALLYIFTYDFRTLS